MAKIIPCFIGINLGSRIDFDPGTRNKIIAYLAKINDGEWVSAVYEPITEKKKRTINQNAYYWLLIDILCNNSAMDGYTKEEAHDALRCLFLKEKKNGIEFIKSTTKLNKDEMVEYIEKIKRWAAEFLGCYLPDAVEIKI